MEAWYKTIFVNGKQRYVHRIIAEQKLGRKLKKGEVVHHIDKNRRNNDPANLEVYSASGYHRKGHATVFRSDTEKECTKCHKVRSRDKFAKRDRKTELYDPHHSHCKQCRAEYMKKWAEKRRY